MKKQCKLCHKEITGRGKTELCIDCYYYSLIGKHTKEWKGEYPKCCDCKKQLSAYHVKRCKSCENHNRAGKGIMGGLCGEKNGMYGVHRFGKDAPTWIDGRSFEPYAPEFNDKLKAEIRQRYNYECQNCKMTEEEHLIVIGTNLIIHHIDYNKQNCKEDNLITVCNSCNARANYNRNYWQEFYQQKVQV